MANATARPTKRQRLVEEFEHQGAEGRRTLETISCSICAEPFEDPVSLRDSGHTYCRVCITQALANHARCPLSNAPIAVPRGYGVDSVLVQNHQVRTLIDSQRVACRYASRGCAARPEVGAADAHEASCPHAPMKCSRCPFLGSRAETEEHMRSCPYVVLAPVLDAQANRIQSLERRVTQQDRTNERLMARLDALERSARTVTPASALRLPCLEASDLTFDATRSGSCVELSRGGGVADCEERYGCAISTVTLRSGTHSWEIRLTRTDTIVGIGVCTESHGFHLDVEGENWCSGPLNRLVIDRAVAAAEAPWCKDVKNGSVLVVTYDCDTGKLYVGPKDGLSMASHVFGELASTPVAPFVFLTSGNTCEIAQYVCSSPRAALSLLDSPPLVVPPVRQSYKRGRSRSSSSSSPSPVTTFRREPTARRRNLLDDVSRYERFDSGLRGAPGRGVGRWSRPPPPPSPSSSSDESSEAPPPPPRRGRVARAGR